MRIVQRAERRVGPQQAFRCTALYNLPVLQHNHPVIAVDMVETMKHGNHSPRFKFRVDNALHLRLAILVNAKPNKSVTTPDCAR